MRLLIIDDEPAVTERIAMYLEELHHQVEVLNYIKLRGQNQKSSPKGFLQILNELQPEGVILDYDMVPPGDRIYRWLREWNETLVIVFYTKYANSPDQQGKMVQAGARKEQIIQKVEAAEDVVRLLRSLREL